MVDIKKGLDRINKSIKLTKKSSAATVLEGKGANANDIVILHDKWGMRFTHYVTDSESREVVVYKEFYEPELLALKKILKKKNVVVDLGANIGMFSVYFSKNIGPEGKVYAFEPIRDTYWRMQENLALNRCENVISYQKAISNKNTTAIMNIFPEGYGAWNTFGKPQFGKIKPISKEKVPVTTLDTFVKQEGIDRIDFLKIDVEGFEYDVLQGASKTFSGNKVKFLSFEISEIPLKGAGRNGKDIFDKLKSYGYTVYRFNPKKKKFEGPISTSDAFYENFYASKTDMRKL